MYTIRQLTACVLGLALTISSAVGAAETVQASPTAKEHFAAGVAHVEDPSGPKYEEAYREFKAAWAESPLYTIALNLGYCAFFLERDQEALEMYELYLAKAGQSEVPKAQRTQLEKDVRSLKAGLVRVSLKVTPAKATLVDERIPTKGSAVINRYPIENGVAQLGIHPGSHRVTVVAEGYQPQSWEFEAQPASSHAHDFNLTTINQAGGSKSVEQPPVAVVQNGPSPMFYASATATGVFAIGTIVTGILANSKKSDFDAINNGTQVSKAQDLRDTTKTYALVSDICLGATVISAGATVYFYLADRHRSESKNRSARWNVVPMATTTRAGVELLGNF